MNTVPEFDMSKLVRPMTVRSRSGNSKTTRRKTVRFGTRSGSSKTVRSRSGSSKTTRRKTVRFGTRSGNSKTVRSRSGSSNSGSMRLTRRFKKSFFRTPWQIEHQSLGIGPLRKGKLEGYHTSSPKISRTRSLNKAVKIHGALSTYRSLNALAVYNKNRSPEVSAIAKEDRDMIKDKYL
jgi:hypothetical protein